MAVKITSDIPFGNVCDVSISESRGVAEVAFAADPHGGPETLWFCFRVAVGGRGARARKVRLTLRHSPNMLGAGTPRQMRPVARYARRDWERLGAPEVEELPDGRRLVSWLIDAPKTFVDVAYCYPYGGEEIDALVRETRGFWKSDVIGVSQGARPIVRLASDCGPKGSQRPGLYLIARQHSGETPGSWVLDGFLRRVATLGRRAPLVWAVPLANIDGVEQGDYGKDNFPYDVNRAWGSPPMRHETLVFQRDVARWKDRCTPALGIDFHGPGGTESLGAYFFLPAPDIFPRMHRLARGWVAAVKKTLTPRYAADDFARVAAYRSRWETPGFARYFCETLGVLGLSMETPYAMAGGLVLTRDDYREIGRRVAEAVTRRLKLMP